MISRVYEFGDFWVNRSTRQLLNGTKPVALTPKAVNRPNDERGVTSEQLIRTIARRTLYPRLWFLCLFLILYALIAIAATVRLLDHLENAVAEFAKLRRNLLGWKPARLRQPNEPVA